MIPGNEQMDKDDFRACLIPASEAATLLSRQHAAFVRLVKNLMPRTTVGSHNYARKEVLKELLAALQQGGKK